MRKLAPLLPLAAVIAAVGWGLDRTGLPSSYLFAALIVGVAVALALPNRLQLPSLAFGAGQAVTGVTIGAYIRSSSLGAIEHSWLAVTLVSAATLGLTIVAGSLLARITTLDPPTAALGMVAGGASGIVGMATELGADDRLVAFMQYLRVLIIVMFTPLFIAVAFPGHGSADVGTLSGPTLGDLKGWLLTVGLAAAGTAIALRLRITAGPILGPMLLAVVVVLAVPHGVFTVPPLLAQSGFALIGLQVGLRFTAETLRLLGRLLAPVLGCIVGLIVASFALALALDLTTSVSLLDAYLATNPGGLYAVLAVAFGAGANTTFILAVQGLRLLVMILIAPIVVRWLTAGFRETVPA